MAMPPYMGQVPMILACGGSRARNGLPGRHCPALNLILAKVAVVGRSLKKRILFIRVMSGGQPAGHLQNSKHCALSHQGWAYIHGVGLTLHHQWSNAAGQTTGYSEATSQLNPLMVITEQPTPEHSHYSHPQVTCERFPRQRYKPR